MKFFRKSVLSTSTCLATAAFAAFGTAGAAQAQDAAPADSAAECVDANNNAVCDKDEKGDIVVIGTGTRLSRPTLSSPVPLTTVTPGELSDGGDVSLGDALNDLPSLRSTFSQGNSTRFIGTAALNILDLRGLGYTRTLVLVNGKRHITALPGDYLVDINTIPNDLVERVDIVTGGNSAVYGSDAVAGVVNFVLKRNYEGLTIKGQGAITRAGDRGNYFIAGTWGKNFADGRGNIAIAAEYAKANPLYLRDRNEITGAYTGRCQINTIENTAGEANGTDGIWDAAYVCGVRNGSISDAGTIGGLGSGVYLRFNDAGNIFVDTPQTYLGPSTGNVLGGNGSTLYNTGIMAAGLERYNVNLLAHYDFSDALSVFVEAKYVHITANQEGQATFMPSSTWPLVVTCDNGFLGATNLATLQGYGLCSAGATNTQTIPFSRYNADLGGRGETHKRETYRIVGGFEGTFNDDWKYELAFNYGEFRSNMNAINVLRMRNDAGTATDGAALAADAVLAPVGYTGTNFVLNSAGQKVICRVNYTSITRPDCIPLNLFGQNMNGAAALAFANGTAQRTERASQFVASFNLSGDLSQLFELPGGPIGFALGSEYREETAFSDYDAASKNGAFFFNRFAKFAPKKLTVKELYGEIDLPLLKDLPFAKELTVRGAGRVSDYNTATGTVWAWNVDGIWAPIEDVRFRAGFATSVRAPTQSDLEFPRVQSFSTIADPCDSANINNNPNRVANCAAAGVPATYTAAVQTACAATAYNFAIGTPWRNCLALTSNTGIEQGGNPTLVAERGKSLTIGVVIEPRFIPGLSLTVDWYKIKVTNLIATLSAQTIVNNCYDNPGGINNSFCATVNRNPTTGMFVSPAVISGGINFAAQKTQGIDIDLAYRKTFENGHKLSFRAIATRVMLLDNYTDPARPNVPNRQLGELGDPMWAANASINYDFGPIDITYGARYIGKQAVTAWESQHQYTGLCPTSGLTGFSGRTCTPGQLALLDPTNNDFFEGKYYPGVIYHNIRITFETADKKYNFYVGADNFMNKKPPLGLLGTTGGDPYDSYGAFYYAGFKANF